MNRQNINIDIADDHFNPNNKHIAPKGISRDAKNGISRESEQQRP